MASRTAYSVGDQAMAMLSSYSLHHAEIHLVDILRVNEMYNQMYNPPYYDVHFVGRHGKYDRTLGEHQLVRVGDQEGIDRLMAQYFPNQPVMPNAKPSSNNSRKQRLDLSKDSDGEKAANPNVGS